MGADSEPVTKPDHDAASPAQQHHHQTRRDRKLAANTRRVDEMMRQGAAESAKASVAILVADLLRTTSWAAIKGAPPEFATPLHYLAVAITGQQNGEKVRSGRCLELFDQTLPQLQTAIDEYAHRDEYTAEYVAEQVAGPLANARAHLLYTMTSDRMHESLVLESGKVYDSDGVNSEEVEREAAATAAAEAIDMLAKVNEVLLLANHEHLYHLFNEMIANHVEIGDRQLTSVAELQGVLMAASGILSLSAGDFQARIAAARGVVANVNSYTEFAAAIVRTTAGVVAKSSAVLGTICRLSGDAEMAEALAGFSGVVVLKASGVIAAIEVIHGIAVLCDPRASRRVKVEAGVDVAAGLATMGAAAGFDVAAAVAAPLAAAAFGVKMGLEFVALVEDAELGVVSGLMKGAIQMLSGDAACISLISSELVRAQALAAKETNHEQLQSIQAFVAQYARELGTAVDQLVGHLSLPNFEAGMANHPGSYALLRDMMAIVMPLKGARTPKAAMHAATVAAERLSLVLSHLPVVIHGAAAGESASTVEAKAHAEDIREEGRRAE